jgi:hypothetical protein
MGVGLPYPRFEAGIKMLETNEVEKDPALYSVR